MAFQVEKINRLYKAYAVDRDEEKLSKLIELCVPLIEQILVTKWRKYASDFEDALQEIQMDLWQSLKARSVADLESNFVNPYVYLYFRIRKCAHRAFERLKSACASREDFISDSEKTLSAVQDDYADPEFLYYFRKEYPQELMDACVQEVKSHPALSGNSERRERVILQIKKRIEEYFGIKVEAKTI